MAELDDLSRRQGGVQIGEFTQGQRNGFENKVVDREFLALGQIRVDLLAHLHQRIHLVFVRHIEVRDGCLGFDQAASNGLAQLGGLDDLVCSG